MKKSFLVLFLLYVSIMAGQDLNIPVSVRESSGKLDWSLYNKKKDPEVLRGGGLTVILELTRQPTEDDLNTLEQKGCKNLKIVENFVQTEAAVTSLGELETLDFVREISEPIKPLADQSGGKQSGEGIAPVIAAGVAAVHKMGYRGNGVKIAVLDFGFSVNPREPKVNQKQVNAISIRQDGDIGGDTGDHGLMCAEVVSEIAPGADIYLINFSTEVEFLEAIREAVDVGVDVVSCAIFWTKIFDFFDGTSVFARSVDDAVKKGLNFVVSSGNRGDTHYAAQFKDQDSDGWYNFTKEDETCNIGLYAGTQLCVLLTWDDWTRTGQDLDLYVLDETSNFIAASETDQLTKLMRPVEAILVSVERNGDYSIAIKNMSENPKPIEIQLYVFAYGTAPDEMDMEYKTAEKSLDNGAATARNSLTVGAIDPQSGLIRSYSSRGPTGDGRIKPELVAPDGISTSHGIFTGTSASAPIVAGVAALLLSKKQNLTPTEVKDILYQSAKDAGISGADNSYGYGIVDPVKAIKRVK